MARDPYNVIGDIEDAILARLQGGLSGVRVFDITSDAVGIKCPAVNVALYNGRFKPIGQSRYRVDAEFVVTVLVANTRDEFGRRRAAYPLFTAMAYLLGHWRPVLSVEGVENDLGAAALSLGEFRQALHSGSRMAYSVRVATNFGFDMPATADGIDDVLAIGLQHVPKPGTAVVVEDTVEIESDTQ